MGFKNNSYCTVWESKSTGAVTSFKEKYVDIFCTISKKNSQTGMYETDFGETVRFIGKAFNQIKTMTLKSKDKLKLIEVEVTQNKSNGKTYNNYICWDVEQIGNGNGNKSYQAPKQPQVVTSDEQIELPDPDSLDLPF